MANPTPAQASRIESWKLPVPKTKAACSALLSYVFDGWNSPDDRIGDRVRSLKSYQKWAGARVRVYLPRHACHECCGEVVALRFRLKKEIEELMKTIPVKFPHPYVAVVRLDPDGITTREVPISGLRVVISNRQGRLFNFQETAVPV